MSSFLFSSYLLHFNCKFVMPKTTKGRPTGMKGGAGQGGNGIFNVGTAGVTRLFQTALRRH